MLSLLLLHYWKETTDRGRRQQRGDILASWKGGSVFEREHLAPLTPGKRVVKVINICVSVTRKLVESFSGSVAVCTGVVPMMPCCVVWALQGWLLVFHFGGSRNRIRNRGPSETTTLWLCWTSLSRSNPTVPKQQAGIDDVLWWLRQSRKHLQCPAVVQGFSERGALFGLRLWDGCLRSQDWLSGNENITPRKGVHESITQSVSLWDPPILIQIRWCVFEWWFSSEPGLATINNRKLNIPKVKPPSSSSMCPSLPMA